MIYYVETPDGVEWRHCAKCQAWLSDRESRARGFGPTCYRGLAPVRRAEFVAAAQRHQRQHEEAEREHQALMALPAAERIEELARRAQAERERKELAARQWTQCVGCHAPLTFRIDRATGAHAACRAEFSDAEFTDALRQYRDSHSTERRRPKPIAPPQPAPDVEWSGCVVCEKPLTESPERLHGAHNICRVRVPAHQLDAMKRRALDDGTPLARPVPRPCAACGHPAAGGCQHCEACALEIVDTAEHLDLEHDQDEQLEERVQRLRGFEQHAT